MTPPPFIRLYAKRPKERRWKLLGEYPSRESAWDAVAAVPKGYEVWLNDVPPAKPEPPAEVCRGADTTPPA
jgi:hypothetical protein